MALNLTEHLDVEERFVEYNARMLPSYQHARTWTRVLTDRVTQAIGEQALLPSQVRAVAFLLGFEDPRCDRNESPFGVSPRTFHRVIEPVIPSEGRLDITNLVTNPTKGTVAFKRTAVEQAFQELARQQKLVYTPEKFQYALEKV